MEKDKLPSLAAVCSKGARAAVSDAPRAAALLVFLVYGGWLLVVFQSGHDVRDFIHMGRKYALASHAKPLLAMDPDYPYAVSNNGYDGQFAYYIALDPVNARSHLDQPNYRYTRILYPITARLLSFGNVELVPYMLIMINWLALAAGTLVLGRWLRRKNLSPWIALVYGLSPGLFICFQADLEEPLAYGLVALAMYLYSYGGRYRLLCSGVAFALAALTRESTAVFPALMAIALLVDRRSPQTTGEGVSRRFLRALLLLAMTLVPLGLYKGFLLAWLGPGSSTVPPALYPRLIPFSGLLTYWPWKGAQVEEFVVVVIPALICTCAGVWALWKRFVAVEVWLLLANTVLFVVLLNPLSYASVFSSARIATGVVLAAILCLPVLDRCAGGNRNWFWLSTACWFVAWPSFLTFTGRSPTSSDLLLDLAGVLLLWVLTGRPLLAATNATLARRERQET